MMTTHAGIAMTAQDVATLTTSLRRRARGTGRLSVTQVWQATADYYHGDRTHYSRAVRSLALSLGMTVEE